MTRDEWRKKVEGVACPMDAPRPDSTEHWDLVARLSVSSFYLSKDQTWRGRSVVIFDPRHAARPDELTRDEWLAFSGDLYTAQDAVVRTVKPDHVNLESLGNVVPHLHWHILPRTLGDPRWGSPIWLTSLADMREVHLEPGDQAELVAALRRALAR
jgi:diadenosine tetraphosphate (Ap4A) HIT family hydrolase